MMNKVKILLAISMAAQFVGISLLTTGYMQGQPFCCIAGLMTAAALSLLIEKGIR